MSHKSFSRILNDQSNKLLLGGNATQIVEQNIDQVTNNLLSDKKISEINPILSNSNSNYYNILGYEMSLLTIIIILILTICVAYFLYKYFFTKTDIVNLKKYSDVKKNLDVKKNSNDKQPINKKQEISNEETENSESTKNSELSSSNNSSK
jgi:hypothetical protein